MIPSNHCETHVGIFREPQIIGQGIGLGAVRYVLF
jgi:hypothetical protein